jgi:ABC-type transport system substrate-binding protein
VKQLALAVLVLLLAAQPAPGQTPTAGGWLNLRLREDLPQGFAIHESPTISTMWPAMPCLSNLVLFDPLKTTHTAEAVIGELAEKWSWQDNYRNLVFFLRADVKWHDGAPFSSEDLLFTTWNVGIPAFLTFDMPNVGSQPCAAIHKGENLSIKAINLLTTLRERRRCTFLWHGGLLLWFSLKVYGL